MKILFCILFGLVASVYSIFIPGFINGKPLRHHLESVLYPEIRDTDCSFVQEYNFTAKIDNFNDSDTDTWNQVDNLYINLYITVIFSDTN